ncbi:MAG TPA: M20/M25/M40 family metallo-hydrolase [Pyrinomonadaceae bacterium]|nr:M20/M25/M40 family metallo-hydrolase [Pyrinomonadaceae bacterium]
MIRRQFAALLLLFTLVVPYAAFAQQPQQPAEDPMIAKIKDEGMNRSQVMQTLSYLTDVIGPRLTASPGMKRSNEWTRDTLAKWGLQNAHLESWGPFGRGWSLKRFSAQVVSPQDIPLIAYPKAWSPSVKVVEEMLAMPATSRKAAKLTTAPPPVSNTVTADVVFLDAKTEADLDKYKGQLKGKIVLVSQPVEVKAMFDAPGRRQDEKSLLALANALPPGQGGGFGGGGGGGRGAGGPQMSAQDRQQLAFQQAVFTAKRWNMLVDEGAAVAVDVSPRGTGGTIFVQSATAAPPIPKTIEEQRTLPRISVYDPKSESKIVPQITVAAEHYNRLIRMIQQGEKLKMTVDLAVEYQDADNMGYNTIAEIPGTDLKDEIVMLGGHMDSWHSATGATDNGAGVAVAMEAVRILQTLGLKPRRTIRIGLWTGEEQGLLGSRAYVGQHFGKLEGGPQFGGGGGGFGGGNANATPAKLTTMPEYEKFSGYFNLDNGTGKIRGIYLQGNRAVRELFASWLMPFRDMGASTITISNTGGTDHQSFDGIGLPGFQFIQDEIEYDTRTHHSNQDVFDRIQSDDMKQAATIMAAFVYNTAMRDEKLPRKPAPGTRATGATTNQ